MPSKIINEFIANKVKVRVVTNVDDNDKTLFAFLGTLKYTDEFGVLLIDKEDKEHYIPFASIVEIQNLGTGDWKEYTDLSIDEIGEMCGFWSTDEN